MQPIISNLERLKYLEANVNQRINGKLEGERVATAPILPTPPKPLPKSTRLNLAKDCIKCELKYPDTAKQRGIEGNPEVTIDYDENGHVTNVRLTQPSGKSELDQALVEQAREFILKPVPGGRLGARVVANFQIKESERDRMFQGKPQASVGGDRKKEALPQIQLSILQRLKTKI
ncbi:MAG: TonB family protein [Stigonema ocellatum SAG 48.90 = DSM 106950]|nr:TonB family protein [Stigonema ocellatum SAG 48.90 = DSM 106950]